VTERWEILAGLPGTGPLPVQFSVNGQGTHREGLVVRFNTAAAWVGNFQPGIGQYSGVVAAPGASSVIVVAAGQAYVVDPERRELARTFGGDIEVVLDLEQIGLVVFSNGLWFEAADAHGLRWQTRRISWDGMRHVEVMNGERIEGEAWSPIDDAWHGFTVTLANGDASGGSYTGPE
jgi:hypothetical protein